jgi:hypothetical protein
LVGAVLSKVLRSSLLGVLLLVALSSCGSRTVKARPSTTEFCDSLAERSQECQLGAVSVDECTGAIEARGGDVLDRARACLEAPCADLAECVNDELGPVVPGPGEPGVGGTGSGTGGAATGPMCPAPVSCLDDATAQHCNEQGELEQVDCKSAMEEQGIVSAGCSTDAEGSGCTIDAFLDPACEAGTPAFAVCAGLEAKDLVNTYVACFQSLTSATAVVACYRDYVNEAEKLVDCSGAQTACVVM